VWLFPSLTWALDGVGGQRHAPTALLPGKDPEPTVQETGWAPGLVSKGAENLSLHGFDPRTVQPPASRYTDGAIPARLKINVVIFILVETTRKYCTE